MTQSHRSMLSLVCTAGAVAAVLLAGAVSTAAAAASLMPLGDLPGGEVDSGAYGVSGDGSVVVGSSSSASGLEAFRWTSDGGMVGLGKLPGGVGSLAYAVNGDGSIVVGGSYDFNDLGTRYTAFYWTADGGMRKPWDLLLSHGVDPAADGWTELTAAWDISADGNTIVGHGIRNNNSYEAFVATIPEPASLGLFVLAAGGLTLPRRRRNRSGSMWSSHHRGREFADQHLQFPVNGGQS